MQLTPSEQKMFGKIPGVQQWYLIKLVDSYEELLNTNWWEMCTTTVKIHSRPIAIILSAWMDHGNILYLIYHNTI